MTLTEFLLARIAEDEEWAHWAGAAQDAERSRGFAFIPSMTSASVTSAGRVLARCEADRALVNLLSPDIGNNRMFEPLPHQVRALRVLATVYADHPDYREEWKP